jgi:hypothetical protein
MTEKITDKELAHLTEDGLKERNDAIVKRLDEIDEEILRAKDKFTPPPEPPLKFQAVPPKVVDKTEQLQKERKELRIEHDRLAPFFKQFRKPGATFSP